MIIIEIIIVSLVLFHTFLIDSPHRSPHRSTLLNSTLLYFTLLDSTILHALFNSIPLNQIILDPTIQYNTILYSTLHCITLYSLLLHSNPSSSILLSSLLFFSLLFHSNLFYSNPRISFSSFLPNHKNSKLSISHVRNHKSNSTPSERYNINSTKIRPSIEVYGPKGKSDSN